MEKKLIYIAPLTEYAHVMYEGMLDATVEQDPWAEGKENFFGDEDDMDQGQKNLWDE